MVTLNLVFFSLPDPAIAHCINQMNWSLLNCFPSTKTPPHWYEYGEIRIWQNVPLSMEGVRVEEIWRIKWWRLWMSQSCFSLGFFFQNSLWKLSTFRGYKGIYNRVYEEYEESVTTKQGILVTRALDWNESRANCLARLEVLSCSATTGMTLQLPLHALHVCHSGDSPVTGQSQDPVTRLFLSAHSWTFLHTLSHTTLTWFPPKYKVSKCWIKSKFDMK